MPEHGPANHIYEQFTLEGIKRVYDAAHNRESEGLFLDYKAIPPEKHQIQKTFATVATAFANSGGGVILWGVNDKDMKAGTPPQPALNIAATLQTINDLANEIALRRIPHIQSTAILTATEKDSGFIVTLVPESNIKPHQSTADGKYYFRTGSNSAVMPHILVEALMVSGRYPSFELHVGKPRRIIAADRQLYKWSIAINAVNIGTATARSVDFVFSSNIEIHRCFILPTGGQLLHNTFKERGEPAFVAPFGTLNFYPNIEVRGIQINFKPVSPAEMALLVIDMRVYSESGSEQRFHIGFELEDFEKAEVADRWDGHSTPFGDFDLLRVIGPT